MFAIIDFAARKGLGAPSSAHSTSGAAGDSAKHRARQTGIRGETYAYWYLRRQGYILVSRNFPSPGIKGEIDMVGYDGQTLAFVEVKTRTVIDSATSLQSSRPVPLTPEEAVNWEKRRNLTRMAGQFLRAPHRKSRLPLRRPGHRNPPWPEAGGAPAQRRIQRRPTLTARAAVSTL
jgi:Holliday junction resolvase-like predicted endonuclease